MDTIIVFSVVIISAFLIFFLEKKSNNSLFSNPENVIKSYGSSKSCPNYLAVHYLKKSLKQNPNHPGLISKLKELEKGANKPTAILIIMVALMVIMPAIFWVTGKIHLYGLTLAVVIIVGGVVIYLRKSIKNNKT